MNHCKASRAVRSLLPTNYGISWLPLLTYLPCTVHACVLHVTDILYMFVKWNGKRTLQNRMERNRWRNTMERNEAAGSFTSCFHWTGIRSTDWMGEIFIDTYCSWCISWKVQGRVGQSGYLVSITDRQSSFLTKRGGERRRTVWEIGLLFWRQTECSHLYVNLTANPIVNIVWHCNRLIYHG